MSLPYVVSQVAHLIAMYRFESVAPWVSLLRLMSEVTFPAEEALALLMSIPDVDQRRDYVSDDLGADRRLQQIDRLSLALVLEVPFGRGKSWRRMGRMVMSEEVTNQVALDYLKVDDKGWVIMERLEKIMPKYRFKVLDEAVSAFIESESNGLAFAFNAEELMEISKALAADLGYELGGEIFWSQDQVVAPSGLELPFVFSMLSQKQLLGCVSGPYDDIDELDPEKYGLIDLDESDW